MQCHCGYGRNIPGATTCRQCGEPLFPKPRRGGGPGGGRKPTGGRDRRHALVGAGAKPVLLPQDKVFELGRSTDCQLTIPSQRVSRQHAQVFWRAGFPVLKNLSSSNPTLVNGKSITEHELRDRDELQVGPYRCTYRCFRGNELLAGDRPDQGATLAEDGAAVAGSLRLMQLPELLLSLERQKKTGTLSLSSQEGEGEIVLEEGRFRSANLGKHSGKKAVLVMLKWEQGAFSFAAKKKSGLKIIRKFDHTAGAPVYDRSFRRTTVTKLLKEAGCLPTADEA